MGGKFKPKTKHKPLRKDSVSTSVSSLLSVATNDIAESKSSASLRTKKPSEHCFSQDDPRNSIFSSPNVATIDKANSTFSLLLDSDVVMPDGDTTLYSSFDKSGENADIFLGLESLDDFLPQATADMEGSVPSSEALSVDVPGTVNVGQLTNPVHSSIDASTCPQLSAVEDPLTGGEPVVSTCFDDDNMDNREVEIEEMDDMDTQVMSELTARSGRRSGKFQPKPKIQIQNKKYEATITNADGEESVSCLHASQSLPSETDYGDTCSNPPFPHDDVLDLSCVGFNHAIPTESMSGLLVSEDPIDFLEASQLNSGFPGDNAEVVPEIPAERCLAQARKSKTLASVHSLEQQKASASSQENEADRSLRPRKNKTSVHLLVDEFDYEVHGDGEFPAECPSSSVIVGENIEDVQFQVENESQSKKVKKKSAKPIKEKPAGKQKKGKEASDQEAKSKPKKFSHSTLKRRRVDKVLLETHEDEIDFQKVPLRDLILLAEHKELLKRKEATTGAPAKQSNGSSSERSNEDDAFASELDRENDHGQASPMVQENVYFNYQTYMDRTPRLRWSKQDTELFYQAVQQFGTDFSMIQQLFPGRTRRQVKLKYKIEERQHPLRLREALTSRAKDHSHFEMVIERLQQIAAEEDQNANKDESIDLTGNEDDADETHEANEEEAKIEETQGGENEDVTEKFTRTQSPVKSCDSDDDFFSQYKS